RLGAYTECLLVAESALAEFDGALAPRTESFLLAWSTLAAAHLNDRPLVMQYSTRLERLWSESIGVSGGLDQVASAIYRARHFNGYPDDAETFLSHYVTTLRRRRGQYRLI